MKNVIRLGDPTTHGGKVVSTSNTNFKVGGVPVACVGDLCFCPLPGHSGCTIVSGSSKHHLRGVLIAFDGDKTSCGAKLISTLSNFSTE